MWKTMIVAILAVSFAVPAVAMGAGKVNPFVGDFTPRPEKNEAVAKVEEENSLLRGRLKSMEDSLRIMQQQQENKRPQEVALPDLKRKPKTAWSIVGFVNGKVVLKSRVGEIRSIRNNSNFDGCRYEYPNRECE